MKVYELIQELAKYDADTVVKFKGCFDFDTEVEGEVLTTIFDDYLDYDGITDKRRYFEGVYINLTY